MNEARYLHLHNATGAIRTEMWQGREHLVVPMVALMEGVIHAVNSKTAEYVSRAALERSVSKWAGHPIVVGHPVKDGRQISAHSPEVLAKHGCGFIRSTSMNGDRLVHETLIDPARLIELGHKALEQDLRAGKGCEVSVGAFVDTNDTKSSFKGKAYDGEWTEIGPDHTALLPGGTGACSREMGCGAHRTAQAYLVTAEGFEALGDSPGHEFHGNQYSEGGGSFKDQTGFINGDKVKYTGETQEIHGGTFHKVEFLEGPRKGTTGVTQYGPNGEGRVKQTTSKISTPQASWGSSSVGKISDEQKFKNYEIMHGTKKANEMRAKAEKKGRRLSMNIADLKSRVLALFDTPEQAASEEAAELVRYNVLRTHLDAAGKAWDEASRLVNELIADEEENPTTNAYAEEAETEVEKARLDAIQSLLGAIMNAASMASGVCMTANLPEPSDPRYAEALRTLIGARNSAKDKAMIQQVHDHATALGAECSPVTAAAKDCDQCNGTGQVKEDGKQIDCPACGGEGTMKAAATTESGDHAAEEGQMTKDAKAAAITALTECSCSGFTKDDIKTLEAMPDAAIERFTALASKNRELRAAAECKTCKGEGKMFGKECKDCKGTGEIKAAEAQSKLAETEAALKAAQAAQIPAEELVGLRALAAERQAADATEHAGLVAQLKTAQKAFTEDELKAKPLGELRKLAQMARVEQPKDFSARGVPVPRAAQGGDFTPPNPYDAGLKALQGTTVN